MVQSDRQPIGQPVEFFKSIDPISPDKPNIYAHNVLFSPDRVISFLFRYTRVQYSYLETERLVTDPKTLFRQAVYLKSHTGSQLTVIGVKFDLRHVFRYIDAPTDGLPMSLLEEQNQLWKEQINRAPILTETQRRKDNISDHRKNGNGPSSGPIQL